MEPTTEKSSKKSKKASANSKAAKAKKEKTPKEPKPPKEPQVVFAFRLREAERNAIHQAAGPGRATRFVLGAALAAAKGDLRAFEAVVAEGKANQK